MNRLLASGSHLVTRGNKLISVAAGQADDCDCCGGQMRIVIDGMTDMDNSSSRIAFWCAPPDPYGRLFCTDFAPFGGQAFRAWGRPDDFRGFNVTRQLGERPAFLAWGKDLIDFASHTRYTSLTSPPCPGFAGDPGNYSGAPYLFSRNILEVRITGVSAGFGNVTFTAVIWRYGLYSCFYNPCHPVHDRESTPVMAWKKVVTIPAGQPWYYQGSVTLDRDSTRTSAYIAETGNWHSTDYCDNYPAGVMPVASPSCTIFF